VTATVEMPKTEFEPHAVLGTRVTPPFPDGYELAVFGMGCFWGADTSF
jgi:peptide-methionine (S)-S-oxide reductase